MPEKPRDFYLNFQSAYMDKDRERRERKYEKERERMQSLPTVIIGTTGPVEGGNVVVNK